MAELNGRKLALDDGGRPRVDDAGRLIYVDVSEASEAGDAGDSARLDAEGEQAAKVAGQGVHTTLEQADAGKHPENSAPEPSHDGADDDPDED